MRARSILLLNGAYGVGKTTVAKRLRAWMRHSALFDPEIVGYVLRRLPRGVPGSARDLDDYRSSSTWRNATIGLAAMLSRAARPLIVPMTLDRELLDSFRDALTSRRCRVEHVCLVASPATVNARLARQGSTMTSREARWVHVKAAAACTEHAPADFGCRIDTEYRTPDQVADAVLEEWERIAR
jgi:chloramphenicol 3-O-phosphotransferase